jgi:hypothetical protein
MLHLEHKAKRQQTLSLKWPHIRRSQNNPYLGLQISEDMKWSTHINNTAKKSQFNLGLPKKKLEIQFQKLQKDRMYHLSKIHN